MENPQQPIISPEELCMVCFASANSSCSNCQNAFYCSQEHQLQDLPLHKESCRKNTICDNVDQLDFQNFLPEEWCQNNLPSAQPEELNLIPSTSTLHPVANSIEKSTDCPPLIEDELFSSFPNEFLSSANNVWDLINNCEGAQDLFDAENFLAQGGPELLSILDTPPTSQIPQSEQINQPSQSGQSNQPSQSEQSNLLFQSEQSNQFSQSGQSNQIAQPGQSNQITQSEQSNLLFQSEQANQTAQSGQSNHIAQSGESNQIAQSAQFNKIPQPQSNQLSQSGQSNQIAQSEQPNQIAQPRQSNQTAQSAQFNQIPRPQSELPILNKKVLNLMGGASLQSICSDVVRDLNKFGICVLDKFLGDTLGNLILTEVKNLYNKGIFKKGELVVPNPNLPKENVRSDVTMWANGNEPECLHIGHLMQVLDIVMTTCNKFQDSGALSTYKLHRRTKAMIACYPGDGTHYKKHIDNPHKDGRCVTCIYYLNKNWNTETDGGMLRMFPSVMKEDIAQIEPIFDRMIFFWSDKRNPHEVLRAFRTRFAITVWYFDADERDKALIKARVRRQGPRKPGKLAGK